MAEKDKKSLRRMENPNEIILRLQLSDNYNKPLQYKNINEAIAATERTNYLIKLLKDEEERPHLSFKVMMTEKNKWIRHCLWKNMCPQKGMAYRSSYLQKYISNLPNNYN